MTDGDELALLPLLLLPLAVRWVLSALEGREDTDGMASFAFNSSFFFCSSCRRRFRSSTATGVTFIASGGRTVAISPAEDACFFCYRYRYSGVVPSCAGTGADTVGGAHGGAYLVLTQSLAQYYD